MSLRYEQFMEAVRRREEMDKRLTRLIGFNPTTSNHYGQIKLYNYEINSETPDAKILKLYSAYTKWKTEILNIFMSKGFILDNERFNKLFTVDFMYGTMFFLGERLDLNKDINQYRKLVEDYIKYRIRQTYCKN